MLKTLLTDANDQYDVGFVLWALGVVSFLGLAWINWSKFDPQTFGIGFGSALAAGGVMSWLRKGM